MNLYNSNNFLLLENNNIFIEKKISASNQSFESIKNNNKNRKSKKNKDLLKTIFLSRNSIGKISHKKRKTGKIVDKKLESIKYFSPIDYLKTLIFKKEKESYNFLRIFRKHLLSEEHLFKSHMKLIFLEKQPKTNEKNHINLLECFNEL